MVLTVVMPGSVKRNRNSLAVAEAGVEAVRNAFKGHIRKEILRDLETGYEAFFITDTDVCRAKTAACAIEDGHALGRLMDIDVFTADATPVSRTQAGHKPRRCLLCGDDARVCMRARRHSYDELETCINNLILDYVR